MEKMYVVWEKGDGKPGKEVCHTSLGTFVIIRGSWWQRHGGKIKAVVVVAAVSLGMGFAAYLAARFIHPLAGCAVWPLSFLVGKWTGQACARGLV